MSYRDYRTMDLEHALALRSAGSRLLDGEAEFQWQMVQVLLKGMGAMR